MISNYVDVMTGTSVKLKFETTARELIKVNKDVIKYGLLRKQSSKLLSENWPIRFVVLFNDSIHVYQDENSPNPSSVLEFREYDQVVENTSRSYDCCFSVLGRGEARTTSSKSKTFSCLGENELKEWIAAIRKAMGGGETKNTDDEMVGDLYRDEHEYAAIDDIRIIRENGQQAETTAVGLSTTFHRAVGVSDGPSYTESTRRLHCNSLPIDSTASSEPPPRPSVRPQPRPVSALATQGKSQNAPRRSPPKPPMDVPACIPESDSGIKSHPAEVINHDSEGKHIYDKVEVLYDEESILDSIYNDYTFIPPNGKPSLVGDCTITDKFPDRDRCIALLKSTREPGVYLVRNSRKGKQRVLAYLSERGEVIEYIIFEEGSKVTINHSSYFGSLEELLKHYSKTQLMKGTGEHLKKGIHLLVRSRKSKV